MATPKTIGDLEQELGSLQTKLFPLYAAQEAAQVDFNNAEAAQHSASGAHLTDMVLAARKYRAEVERFTNEIIPLKARADALKCEINVRKRVEQVAKMRAIGTDQVEPVARVIAKHAADLAMAVAQYCKAHAALLAVGHPDEGHGINQTMDLGGIADFIWLRLSEAGLPMRKPLSAGVNPTDAATEVVSLLETLR